MLFRDPRLLAFLLIAIGGGLCVYYGQALYALPEWSEAEIEQSVELNLQLDLQRLGPHLRPTGEKLDRLRELVRAEVVGEINREKRQLQRWLGLGLVMLVLGLGRAATGWALRPRK